MCRKLTFFIITVSLSVSLSLFATVMAEGSGPGKAGKAPDNLIWSTDREQDIVLPYYDESRTVMITSLLTHDTLLYRDPATFEYVPRKVGIKANLKYMQNRAMQEFWKAGESPLTGWSWGSYAINDISAITTQFVGKDAGAWDYARDSEVHQWMETGDTSVDPEERKANYKKALTRIAEQVYILPLYSVPRYYGFSEELNFVPHKDELPRFFNSSWK